MTFFIENVTQWTVLAASIYRPVFHVSVKCFPESVSACTASFGSQFQEFTNAKVVHFPHLFKSGLIPGSRLVAAFAVLVLSSCALCNSVLLQCELPFVPFPLAKDKKWFHVYVTIPWFFWAREQRAQTRNGVSKEIMFTLANKTPSHGMVGMGRGFQRSSSLTPFLAFQKGVI